MLFSAYIFHNVPVNSRRARRSLVEIWIRCILSTKNALETCWFWNEGLINLRSCDFGVMGFSFILSQSFSQLKMAIFGGDIEFSNQTFRIVIWICRIEGSTNLWSDSMPSPKTWHFKSFSAILASFDLMAVFGGDIEVSDVQYFKLQYRNVAILVKMRGLTMFGVMPLPRYGF